MAEPVRIGPAIGPRLVAVQLPSCYGCPALRTKAWRDDSGEHTTAYCSATDGVDAWGSLIAVYWRLDRHPPSWCPAEAIDA